jgi:hypothetical protein
MSIHHQVDGRRRIPGKVAERSKGNYSLYPLFVDIASLTRHSATFRSPEPRSLERGVGSNPTLVIFLAGAFMLKSRILCRRLPFAI